MSNTTDRRAQAEATLLADALQSATDTLAQQAAQREAQVKRVQAEFDLYLERSMLWQTAPAPEPEYWPVPHRGAAMPRPYAEAENWNVPDYARSEPSRVNWRAVVAVGGTLAVLPYVIPAVVSAVAPVVAAAVSVLLSVVAWAAVGAVVVLAVRAGLSEGRAAEVRTERPSRKITVTVEVED